MMMKSGITRTMVVVLIMMFLTSAAGCATRGTSAVEKAAEAIDLNIEHASDPEDAADRAESALKNTALEMVKCTPFNRMRGKCS